MYYYKGIGYYKGIDGKYYCNISYDKFKSKREVKKFIKKNKNRWGEFGVQSDY